MQVLLHLAAIEADPGAEAGLAGLEFEKAAAGNLLAAHGFAAQVVVHGVAAAETAIDVVHVPVAEHVVTVVVVPRDDGLDVLHFAELGQQAAVDPGRAGRFPVRAGEK